MAKQGGEGKLRKVAELKARLQKRIDDMEAELEELHVMLQLVDETLLERGFKRAEIGDQVVTPPQAEAVPSSSEVPLLPPEESERKIPLKTVTGDLLAIISMSKDSMRILPAEDKTFDIKTPPFTSFLVERVLAKMQESDREAASRGEITPDMILSYNIDRDGDLIRGLTITNIKSGRLRELKSAVRWTFEKMYEKTVQAG